MILAKLKPHFLTASTNWGRYNLLHLCAHQDWEETVQVLLDKFRLEGLNSDHVGRTLLHWAVEYGWRYGLIDHGRKPKSWLDRQDRDGLTALHLAVKFRNIDAVTALLNQGANYLLPDKHGKNAVHLAAEMGFRVALKAFMAQKTCDFGRDSQGATLLHYLCMWQESNLITRTIERKGLRVNVRDKNRR
jgi:Ankyrin repeats (many copies)